MHSQISLSEMFRSYEQDYKAHMESVMLDLLKMSKDRRDEADKSFSKVSDELQQTEQCIKQMELEASTLPGSYKKELMETIKQYKRDMAKVEKDFKQLQLDQQEDSSREKLFNDRQINQALLKQEDRLIRQTLELEAAKRTAYLTEQQANQISLNLHSQSMTLDNSIRKTQYIREDLGESNNLVKIMKNRIMKRKFIVYGVFGFLGLCLAIAIMSWFI
ncbi:unnamed protein product (macronuclear) [Paramecium tetraurelia]|uniref:Vesicle transport v-SNARE N-terminal domain-containing protein n=1 Tax=Paramecium tetraurelia TaxID=5888 RepID=A0DY55_PARTE|nr:uncharacterized protein GSPATT00002940001 [Paramecium tetraurelia]CAK87972.1 unnamed protein product [Paramecium tetraurelia]|eukprot:XP_001455369.1 hypothetical protein (macronuclear) [Paramecium tetraurelia strain d4-2]